MDAETANDTGLRNMLSKLEVGLPLRLLPEGYTSSRDSYEVHLRGWEDFSYILTTMPEYDAQKPPLRAGLNVTVRLLAHGIAFGFQTRIIEMMHRPVTLMVLRFPAAAAQKGVRAHKRLEVFIVTELTVNPHDAAAKRTVSGRMRDIAIGGCCVECDEDIDVGTEVQLSFTLPNGDAVEGIAAEVKNRRTPAGRHQYGMQFIPDSSPESVSTIERFFESYVPD